MVIKVLIVTLYLHLAKCSTIYSFHTYVERLDWLSFIENIEQSCLGITKVHSIQDKAFTYVNAIVTTAFRAKKKEWANLKNQSSKPN